MFIAYFFICIPIRYDNVCMVNKMNPSQLFAHKFTISYLRHIYDSYIKDSNSVGLDKINRETFHKRIGPEISTIKRKANNNTYHFTSYKQKLISKGAKKLPRTISIPTIRDRVTLKSLCTLLQEIYPEIKQEISQSKISRLNERIKTEAFDSFIKIDLSNFYSTIPHTELIQKISKKTKSKKIIELIINAIRNTTIPVAKKGPKEFNKLGVPQGISISNILADIYLLDLDTKYSALPHLHYERYVDDILLLCDSENLSTLAEEIINDLKYLKLHPHAITEDDSSKSYKGSISDGFSFLGYTFINDSVSIRNESIHKLENSLSNLFTTYKYKSESQPEKAKEMLEWRLNLRITGCIFNNTRRGWLFYFSQLNDIKLLYRLDSYLKILLRRYQITDIKLKKFSRAYFEMKKTNNAQHCYVINFDTISTDEKRVILEKYIGINRLQHKNDEDIERLFKYKISHVIDELESDILSVS